MQKFYLENTKFPNSFLESIHFFKVKFGTRILDKFGTLISKQMKFFFSNTQGLLLKSYYLESFIFKYLVLQK